jgi:hypothetical protein
LLVAELEQTIAGSDIHSEPRLELHIHTKERKRKEECKKRELTSTYRAYPFGAILLASGEEIERVFLPSFPVSYLERQSGWYSATSAARVTATRCVADATSATSATIPKAGRFHHVDTLHGDSSTFLAAL